MRQVFADDTMVVTEGDNWQLIELKKGKELKLSCFDPSRSDLDQLDFTITETVTLKGPQKFILTNDRSRRKTNKTLQEVFYNQMKGE